MSTHAKKGSILTCNSSSFFRSLIKILGHSRISQAQSSGPALTQTFFFLFFLMTFKSVKTLKRKQKSNQSMRKPATATSPPPLLTRTSAFFCTPSASLQKLECRKSCLIACELE